MACSKLFIMVATVLAALFVPQVLATEFVVGDETGWTNKSFDYQAWAQGKQFHVGDALVFRYTPGVHNVLKVNGTGFQQCMVPAGTEALITGNDVIPLLTPGRKWYICGVIKHCESGNQKLAITVLPISGSPVPAPSPIPTSAATGKFASTQYGRIMPMIGMLGWLWFSL